jgi:hypothetical protein
MRAWMMFATVILCAVSVRAELSSPRLNSVWPAGGKQGSEFEVEVKGGDVDEPRALYFSHPGITAEYLPPDPEEKKDEKKDANKKRRKKEDPPSFKIKIAPDVPVGDYDVRFVGKFGISNPRAFCVSDVNEMEEVEPNNEREKAQRLTPTQIVNARVEKQEDVDWYVFAGKKGQRLIAEIRAWRIDSRLDAVMFLYDSEGKQLFMSQDEDLRDEKRDPLIDFDVPADGDYYLKVTDFTYNGSSDYFYRLSIGTTPYVDFITPTTVAPGTTAKITYYGRNLPGGEPTDLQVNGRPIQKITRDVAIPNDPDSALGLQFSELLRPWSTALDGMELRVPSDQGTSNAQFVRFSTNKVVDEVEPNNEREKAQRVEPPVCISGQFMKDDTDCFVFSAKKDERIYLVVYASRYNSPADPDMEIFKADGGVLSNPQDWGENIGKLRFTSNTRDIYFEQKIPADGDYTVSVEHLFRQARGGPQYKYDLEILREPAPDFRLVCSPPDEIKVDAHLLERGGRERLDILVWRLFGHDEPITVEARNLPPGVTAEPFVIGKGVKWGTLILTATPDAQLGDTPIEVVGTSTVKDQKLERKARGGQIVWDTVNTPALARATHSIMLSVRDKSPFKVTVEPSAITVKKGDSFDLLAKVERFDKMNNAIQINGSGYQLPPNLSIPTTNIDSGQNEGKMTIKADKIPEGVYSFMVQGDGQVPIDEKKNLRRVYPSNTVTVTVLPADKKEEKK